MKEVDLAVIGGGPAGLAAAISAKKNGADNILILERDNELGGILNQCIHTGFGLHIFKEELTGPEYAERFIQETEKLKIKKELETMVLNINKDKTIIASNKKGILEIKAKAIILAMGCRERTRGALNIPGDRPSGIFTAGTAQRLTNIEGYLPGKEIIILGSGDIGLIMARRFTWEGCKVKAVAEILPYPSGLTRNVVQCLQDFNIPLYLEHTVIDIYGKERIKGVTIAKVKKNGEVIKKSKKEISCDTLLLSVGLIPENELSKKAGIILSCVTGGPIVNEFRETNIRGVFSCGNVLQVHDLVDNVSEESFLAGESSALYIQDKLPKIKNWKKMIPGENISYIVPQKISGEREVNLYIRVNKIIKKAILKIQKTNIYKSYPILKPAEMITFKLEKKHLEEIKNKDEIVLEIKGENIA